MKKKILLSVIVLVLVLVCLTACNKNTSTLQDMTDLLKVNYSKITLHVTTTASNVELKGVYTFTFEKDKTTVEYSFEKLNELSLEGGNADEYISTVTGKAVVQNGNIVEGDTSVTLPQEVTLERISFKQAFFTNQKVTSNRFEADVKYPKGFTGNSNLECSNMHVKVLHRKDSLSQIAITYDTQSGSNVNITYVFTK